jgi:hypothetical protein
MFCEALYDKPLTPPFSPKSWLKGSVVIAGTNHSRPFVLFNIEDPPTKFDRSPPAIQIFPVHTIARPNARMGAVPAGPLGGPEIASNQVVAFVEYFMAEVTSSPTATIKFSFVLGTADVPSLDVKRRFPAGSVDMVDVPRYMVCAPTCKFLNCFSNDPMLKTSVSVGIMSAFTKIVGLDDDVGPAPKSKLTDGPRCNALEYFAPEKPLDPPLTTT